MAKRQSGAAGSLGQAVLALTGCFLINEISYAYRYLGQPFENDLREQLLKLNPQQLIQEAQLAGAAVQLRQQTEAAHATRRMINYEYMKPGPGEDNGTLN